MCGPQPFAGVGVEELIEQQQVPPVRVFLELPRPPEDRTPAGHLLPGEYIVYAFLNIPSITRYQVVQRELETLDITLVPGEGFGEPVLEQIRREIAKAVGASVAIRFHIADDIAPSPSGKFRVAICELGQQAVAST